MLGLVPLIKFVGMILGVMVVAGLIVDFIMPGRSSTRREALLAAVLPGLVAGAGFWLTMGSFHALALYFKGSLELSRGYNLAMSLPGRSIELLAGFEVLVLFAAALVLLAIRDRRMAGFFILLLAAPVLVHFKHGFVRQDLHIVYAFCFVAVEVTVLTSLALAGGPLGTAAMSKAKIVRESSQGIMVISLNLKDIMNQQTPDMVMKAGDVLVVPGSGLKDFTTKTIPGLSMGLTNVVTSALILQ
jgi:hypothetical protein